MAYPSIRDGLATWVSVEGQPPVKAAWARMYEGTREDSGDVEANDPLWEMLTATAYAAWQTPAVWLDMPQIYGDLARHEALRQRLRKGSPASTKMALRQPSVIIVTKNE